MNVILLKRGAKVNSVDVIIHDDKNHSLRNNALLII